MKKKKEKKRKVRANRLGITSTIDIIKVVMEPQKPEDKRKQLGIENWRRTQLCRYC